MSDFMAMPSVIWSPSVDMRRQGEFIEASKSTR
jgi:hypothetical protein